MREFILENLMNTESLDIKLIILNNIVSLAGALFIMLIYKISYTGSTYSRRFNISLGMITVITTMIMSVISNNVALSLGMVGALSIIRFRTAVKDVRDAAFIFWTIAVGIGCGISQYILVAVGSVTIFIFLLIFRQVVADNRKLLIVQSSLEAQNKIEAAVNDYFEKTVHETMKNASVNGCELVYRVREGALKKAAEKNVVDIVQKLMAIEGVLNVNLVEELDDIGR